MVTSILREVVDLTLTYTVLLCLLKYWKRLSLVFISVNVPYILENILHEIAAQFNLGTYKRLTTFWNLANFISVKLRKSQQQFQQFLLPYKLSCRHTLCRRWKWYLKVQWFSGQNALNYQSRGAEIQFTRWLYIL